MNIVVNGETRTVASETLAAIVEELGYGSARVATALDGAFVPAALRQSRQVEDGARIEILAPMQGG